MAKDYSWLRTVPQLETTPEAMDAIIVAAEMDGCWKVLTNRQGVTRVDGDTPHTQGISMLMMWLASDEEVLAWQRLLELAAMVTNLFDENRNAEFVSKRKG